MICEMKSLTIAGGTEGGGTEKGATEGGPSSSNGLMDGTMLEGSVGASTGWRAIVSGIWSNNDWLAEVCSTIEICSDLWRKKRKKKIKEIIHDFKGGGNLIGCVD